MALSVYKSAKSVTEVTAATVVELDAHQVVFYNIGQTTAFVDDVPIYPRGTYSEIDYNVLVHYNDRVNIRFEGTGIDKLLIIQKKYYP